MFLGNSRAIIRKFKLSRHACKKYANLGFLTGLKKSSF
jgi:ribosomal protein S14